MIGQAFRDGPSLTGDKQALQRLRTWLDSTTPLANPLEDTQTDTQLALAVTGDDTGGRARQTFKAAAVRDVGRARAGRGRLMAQAVQNEVAVLWRMGLMAIDSGADA